MIVMPTSAIAMVMANLGPRITSNKFRTLIISYVGTSTREAFWMKGVIVEKVQVDVPAAMFNLHSRVSEEARRVTVTVCDDVERAAAWRRLEELGHRVLLGI